MDTNWGLVADQRINKNIDFDKIKNKDDYIRAVRDFLYNTPNSAGEYTGRNILNARRRSAEGILSEMYEESKAQTRLRDFSALKEAQAFQRKRGRRGRIDARRTAKDTRRVNQRTVRKWKVRPNRFDLRGIDTKKFVKNPRKHLINKKDLGLKNIRVIINIRGVKQYRDSRTGRFIKKPY